MTSTQLAAQGSPTFTSDRPSHLPKEGSYQTGNCKLKWAYQFSKTAGASEPKLVTRNLPPSVPSAFSSWQYSVRPVTSPVELMSLESRHVNFKPD